MKFKPYPKYKPSGVEWLGDVPERWDVRKLAHIFDTIGSGTTPKSDTPEFYENGEFPWVNTGDLNDGELHSCGKSVSKAALEGYTSLKIYPEGSVVIAMYGATIGKLAILRFPATVNQACCVFFGEGIVHHKFLFYWLFGFREQIVSMATGGGQPNISQDTLRTLRLACPKLPEQFSIAAFLDRETAKIDTLIAKQEALIDLLNEKRQAVISHAVTKGLDPTVAMKPSGVVWLGDVPEHWIVMTLTRITQSKCDGPFGSGLKNEHYTDGGARVIRLQNIRATHFHGTDAVYVDLNYFQNDLAKHDVQEGDLLIAGLGDDKNLVGRACVAPPGIAPALVKADCFRFRLDLSMAFPKYVAFQLCCSADVDAGTLSSGSTRSRIPLSTMASRIIALPPTHEQKAIGGYIDSQTRKFGTLIAKAQQAIVLQKEHRTALISAAVTGKIDVRSENNLRKAA